MNIGHAAEFQSALARSSIGTEFAGDDAPRATAWRIAREREEEVTRDLEGLSIPTTELIENARALDKYVFSVLEEPGWRDKSSTDVHRIFAPQARFMRNELANRAASPALSSLVGKLDELAQRNTLSYNAMLDLSEEYATRISDPTQRDQFLLHHNFSLFGKGPGEHWFLESLPYATDSSKYIPVRVFNTLWARATRLVEIPSHPKVIDLQRLWEPWDFAKHDSGHSRGEQNEMVDDSSSHTRNSRRAGSVALRRQGCADRLRIVHRFRQAQRDVSNEVAEAMEEIFFYTTHEARYQGRSTFREFAEGTQTFDKKVEIWAGRNGWSRDVAASALRHMVDFGLRLPFTKAEKRPSLGRKILRFFSKRLI